jgi:hypothetical protein
MNWLRGEISPIEVYMIEEISYIFKPKNIFIIGNAFGWSTIVMSLAFPNAKIIALDAGIEGKDAMFGIELTNKIAKNEGLNSYVEYGYSPQDTQKLVSKYFNNNSLDFVFIDGLHTNEQLLKDFYGVVDFCHKQTVYFFHDVINWNMKSSFFEISTYLGKSHDSKILYRTTSGMGICIPKSSDENIKFVVSSFTEKDEYIAILNQSLTTKSKIKSTVAKFIPNFIKKQIKRLLK